MIVTLFTGGKTDVFPARAADWVMPQALEHLAEDAPGLEKSEAGFVCFVRMKPGTDVTVAELNLQRAKEGKPALAAGEERIVRTLGYRNYAHVAEVTAIGIDYDEFPDEPPNWDPSVWPCDVYAHTTHNWTSLRPGKWRVILPLALPIPIEKELAVRKALQRWLPRGAILRAPHQPAFLPTCPADMTCEVKHVRQTEIPALLDWRNLPDLDEAETVHANGEAGGTLLGAEFDARGLVHRDLGTKLDVVCPWHAEHKSGGDLGYLYYSEDGLGKFGCAHGACKDRGSSDVYELWFPEANSAESLSPPNTGGEEVSQPVKPSRFLEWGSLMEPLGEVPWLVKDLEICPGRPPMFISDSGVGKTWTLQALALAVACGLPVFGRFPCRKGPVLHLSRDSGLRATKKRYQRLARGMGIDRADVVVFPHNLPLTDKFGVFQRAGFKEVNDEVRRGGYALVILDSLAALCPGIDENSTDIGDPLRCTTDDETVWLWAHHTTKSGEGYRGSGAIKAAAGSIYIGKREDDRRIWTPMKASEEHEDGELPSFETEWQVDADGGARIVAKAAEDGDPFEGANSSQQAAWEMLKLVQLRGSASSTELLAAAGASPGVKGRIRSRANEVLGQLAHPSSGLLANPTGDRYILAAGAVVPTAAHKIEVTASEKVRR